MTFIVAMTGGICSGKTTISNEFKKIGIDVIDSDIENKKILHYNKKVKKIINKKLGLKQNKEINFNLLKKFFLSSINNKKWLESILHPLINKKITEKIKKVKKNWCLWVTPLLIEKKLYKKVDRILVIDIDPKIQINRIIKRDKENIKNIKKIMSYQITREKRNSFANDIIINNGDIRKIKSIIHQLNKKYINLSFIKKMK
ncbi:dephospho-CoA kinase [Buchnera aphidicola (Neophyllaphis varicolor)]|uniref:dephospho-CoA kinase n=1 Tax=Buchnera aphidicola TaxID=9 RepID=UPI0031B83DF1